MAISRADVLSYLEDSNMVEISELIKDIEDKLLSDSLNQESIVVHRK